MSKGIIVVDIPGKCNGCRFWFAKATVPVEYRCMGAQKEITEKNLTEQKPAWCPLRPMPDRKPPSPYAPSPMLEKAGYFTPYDKGWNDCLDEIAIKSN